MRFINFRVDNETRLGVKTEQGVVDVQASFTNETDLPQSTKEVIEQGNKATSRIAELLQTHHDKLVYVEEDQLSYSACVNDPGKIICIGLNYRKHAEESNMPIPEYPILFSKFNNALAGHQEDVVISKQTDKLDYEAELGLVIGKTAKDVSEADALDYVFGYFTANDLSARDLQMRSGQWLLGKTSDGLLPIGPELVTKDEIADPNYLHVTCDLNGERRQDSNTKDMVFNCQEIISYVSKFMTLEAGDIIVTGTPEGVIMGYPKGERNWIKPGDEVTITIEGLGALTNTFIADK